MSGTSTPVNQPPVAAFTSTCTGLTCTFNASGLDRPGRHGRGYSWSWGDGTTTPSSTATQSHTYSTGGTDAVTLTVTDNGGATGSLTQSVFPSSGTASPVTFSGVSNYDATGASASVTVPTTTVAGDQLLLFESYASTSATATPPAGWTQVGTATSHSNLTTAVFARTAQAEDAGTTVAVTFSASVSASLTLADYAGATGGVESAASSVDTSTANHVSPTLTGLANNSLAVTFWSDKSTGTTGWTPPASVTVRSAVFGTKAGADSGLETDSGTPVSGTYGGLTATSSAVSGSGATWTVALAGG